MFINHTLTHPCHFNLVSMRTVASMHSVAPMHAVASMHTDNVNSGHCQHTSALVNRASVTNKPIRPSTIAHPKRDLQTLHTHAPTLTDTPHVCRQCIYPSTHLVH